jgi:hypothetical protein
MSMMTPEKLAAIAAEIGTPGLQEIAWRFILGVAVGELKHLGASTADINSSVSAALHAADQHRTRTVGQG